MTVEGDTYDVTLTCGFCFGKITEDVTAFCADNGIDIRHVAEVPAVVSMEVMRRGGGDVVASSTSDLLHYRCAACKAAGITTKQEMITITKSEYQRLVAAAGGSQDSLPCT
jgi:hypothetical protein